MSLFWSLPGPSSFIEAIATEVRAGNSIVVAIPLFHPPYLSSALRDAIRDDCHWNHLTVEPDRRPAETLFANCVSNTDVHSLRTAANLVKEAEFWNRAIWIEGITLDCVNQWCEF